MKQLTKSQLYSTMTGKLEGILAVNSNPLTNDFCQSMCKNPKAICSQCYSQAMLKGVRSNCVPKFERVGSLLSTTVLESRDLPKGIKEEYARFSAHGELINEQHLLNYIMIANHNPKTRWALWTKRKDIIAKYKKFIPKNVVLVYSNPFIDKSMEAPVGFNKVFSVFTQKYAKVNKIKINCGAKDCLTCLKCYKTNKITVVSELLK